MSKHSRFRQNIQLLFYYLNDSNMRNLNAGIFYVLNVLDSRYKYTAANYLQQLKDNLLECNLHTIFSRLRGTAAYWEKPRRELKCMINEFGPVTFFVTVSPGEWNWPDLGEFIEKFEDLENNTKSISQLVVDYPVASGIFIKTKFKAIMAYLLSDAKPIG